MLPNPGPLTPGPPLVHHPHYTVRPWPARHRFPMPKFALLRDRLLGQGVATPQQFHRPRGPADDGLLALVHDPAYIDAFTQGTLDAGAQRRIGLPWSTELVRRTKTAVAGTVLACELALQHGLATQCAGGTHHAHHGYGSGFCIFNDMAVAAAELRRRSAVGRVLIVDLDVHQGDGTAAIFQDEPGVFTFSVHAQKNFPLRKAHSDLDLGLPDGVADDAYLALLEQGLSAAEQPMHADSLREIVSSNAQGEPRPFAGLRALLHEVEPDLVIYDAGVDPYAGDRLGKLALSLDGLYQRDRRVIDTTRALGVPVACVIGGGYSVDPAEVAERHAIVHRAAADHAHAIEPAPEPPTP
ncbi:MAG: histone deacetylase [Planctomycetota bacterium]